MSENVSLRPAVFLDRDGTLNEIVYDENGLENSPFRPEDLVLLPGAGEFTRRVRDAGYLAVLATNQPGVAKGRVTIEGLDRIHEHLLNQLARDGGGLGPGLLLPASSHRPRRISDSVRASLRLPKTRRGNVAGGRKRNGHRPRAILDGGRQDARR